MSLYEYVSGNPLVRRDPTGKKQWWGLYCGTDNPAGPPWPPPQDDLDKACFDHDMCYATGGYGAIDSQRGQYGKEKNCQKGQIALHHLEMCDRALYNEAMRIMNEEMIEGNPDPNKRLAARLIGDAFRESCWSTNELRAQVLSASRESASRMHRRRMT